MEQLKVLDHGYVKFVEAWGSGETRTSRIATTPMSVDPELDTECGIVEAARQSTAGSFRGWDQDEKLLSYLFNSKPQHSTPFEFAGMVVEVQAPIFVFREWHRHRTQSYNEMSARYSPLPDLNYVPTLERVMRNASGTNKQAGTVKDAESLDDVAAQAFRYQLEEGYAFMQGLYERALRSGVPKELARVGLPVGRYSKMRASANLRNWLAFMTLRADKNAQWEIQQYAQAVGEILNKVFPKTMALFLTASVRAAANETMAGFWVEHVKACQKGGKEDE